MGEWKCEAHGWAPASRCAMCGPIESEKRIAALEAELRAFTCVFCNTRIQSDSDADADALREATRLHMLVCAAHPMRGLEADLAAEREVTASFRDGYHAIAEALGTTAPETSDEDLVGRIRDLKADLDVAREEVEQVRNGMCKEQAARERVLAEAEAAEAEVHRLARVLGKAARMTVVYEHARARFRESVNRPGARNPELRQVAVQAGNSLRKFLQDEGAKLPAPSTSEERPHG